MATSGSKNFSLTRNDIINAGLRKIGEYDKGETPSGDETADASEALNVLINELAGVYGADIFLRTEATLFLQKGQAEYGIGPSGNTMADTFTTTTIDGLESAPLSALTVVDSTGMTVGDIIGIEQTADSTVHWSTISSITSATEIVIGLDTTADTTNGAVWSFTAFDTTDHITEAYVQTALSAAHSAFDIVITVDSTAGMSPADFIGVKLTDNSIHWTQILAVDSATQVTIYQGLASAASDDGEVYAYTTKAYRPRSIFAPYRRSADGSDNQIDQIGEQEYRNLTLKSSVGVPNLVHYRASLDSGTLYVWPTGDGNTDKIVILANYYPDDFDSASDNAQFPVEWSSALIWGLAAELGPEYGLPDREQKRNFQIAAAKRERALDADIEDAPVIFARSSQATRG